MPKVRDPSMPLYVADWLSSESVTAMTLEQQGAFMRLLCHAWLSGSCSLPDNDTTLAALSTLGEKWAGENAKVIRDCFKKKRLGNETRIVNDRQYKEWQSRRKHSEKSREGGLKSGQSRRSVTNQTRTKQPTKREAKTNLTSSSSSSSAFTPTRSILDACLAKVQTHTLSDTGALLAWIDESVTAGAFDGSQATRDAVAGLAFRCRVRGRNGGGGLFTKLMREGRFDHASQADFDAALDEIASHQRKANGHADADVAAFLTDFGKIPEEGTR